MIQSVTISDSKKTPFRYLPNLFENGTTFNFKPGVNIIIGKNGSGKSTLLNLIAKYTLCEKHMYSTIPNNVLSFSDIFNKDNILDGACIHSDYIGKVFNLLSQMDQYEILDNIHNFSLHLNSVKSSSGEKTICAIGSLLKIMFEQKDYSFPIKELEKMKDVCNEKWKFRIDSLLKYYKKNRISEEIFEYTVLMDEPDKNLDVDNIMQIYDILSIHKPHTQIIAVIHNPALIYKLSKLECVNLIEMNKHYLKQVIDFINK